MAGRGEDDLIEPFFAILSLLFLLGKFRDGRKAGVTLCSSLISTVRGRSFLETESLTHPNLRLASLPQAHSRSPSFEL